MLGWSEDTSPCLPQLSVCSCHLLSQNFFYFSILGWSLFSVCNQAVSREFNMPQMLIKVDSGGMKSNLDNLCGFWWRNQKPGCGSECRCAAQVWRPGEDFRELVLSFHPGMYGWTQAARLAWQVLPLSISLVWWWLSSCTECHLSEEGCFF